MNESEQEIYRSYLRFEESPEIAKRLGLSKQQVDDTIVRMREKFKGMNSSKDLTDFLKDIGMTK